VRDVNQSALARLLLRARGSMTFTERAGTIVANVRLVPEQILRDEFADGGVQRVLAERITGG